MEAPITVAAFNDREPAEQLASRLHETGIPAQVFDESAEQKWQLWNVHPRAHMHVRVHSSEEARADALLDEWQGSDPALAMAVKCPQCGSLRVQFPQFSRRTLMGALPAMAAAIGIVEQDYFCEHCQFTWPAEVKPEPDLDRLYWRKTDRIL